MEIRDLQFLKDGIYSGRDFINIVRLMGYRAIGFARRYYYSNEKPSVFYFVENDSALVPDQGRSEYVEWQKKYVTHYKNPSDISSCFALKAYDGKNSEKTYIVKDRYGYAEDNGDVIELSLEITYTPVEGGSWSWSPTDKDLISVKVRRRKLNNMQYFDNQWLTSQSDLKEILQNKNQWLKKFADEHPGIRLEYLLMAPYMETLYKANYNFAKDFLGKIGDTSCDNPFNHINNSWNRVDQGYLDKINRLCQQGKSPKEIFKCPKELYEALKNECNLDTWDHLRVMCKMDNLSPDCALLVLDQNYSDRDLRMIRGILNKDYNGKKIFTFETLANYLHRLDMHEAIERWEALEILEDYLRMCNQLEMQPKVDGDSLKREHDIAARLCRQHRNEMFSHKIAARADYLNKFNFSDNTYVIRAIKDQPDLIDEATQQHNCVAGYASWIADGKSNIFVCRKKESPDRSLVTVELSPNCGEIRQKYMAYNKPIYDRELTEFLDNWLERCKTIKEAE